MKNLHEIVLEGILDDQDDIIGKMTDDALESTVLDAFKADRPSQIKYKYDAKKNIIKISNGHLYLTLHDGKACITVCGTQIKYTYLEDLTSMGVKFDADLLISADVINSGIKLSQCNIVGKKHRLSVANGNKISNISSFIDCSIDVFDMINIGDNMQLAADSKLSSFDCVKVDAPHTYYTTIDCNIKDCKSRVLWVHNCKNFIDPNTKFKSFVDALKPAKYEYTRGYSSYGGYGSGKSEPNYKQFCADLIRNNPGCKIIVELGFSHPTLIYKDDSEIKCQEIKGNTPWRKV